MHPRHAHEGLGEPVDLVAAIGAARLLRQHLRPALAAPEAVYIVRQTTQAPRQKMKSDERDDEDEDEREGTEPSAETQDVAPEHHLRRRVALVHNSRSRSTIVLYSRIRGSP